MVESAAKSSALTPVFARCAFWLSPRRPAAFSSLAMARSRRATAVSSLLIPRRRRRKSTPYACRGGGVNASRRARSRAGDEIQLGYTRSLTEAMKRILTIADPRRPRKTLVWPVGQAWPRQKLMLAVVPVLLAAGVAYLSLRSTPSHHPPAVTVMLPPPAVAAIAPLSNPPPTTTAPANAPTANAPAAPDQEPTDAARLATWLEPRSKNGDAIAQYRLGVLYALGKGVKQDYGQAASLLLQSANSGVAEAQYDYGVLCESGLGVAQDPAQAAAWYRKSAEQGHSVAALSLGYAYAKGMGLARNLPEAARWFRRAADLGVINAQLDLALLYEHGQGVAKSPVDAYAWYSLAGLRGDQASREEAERVRRTLSSDQLKRGQSRLDELAKAIAPH